MIPPKFYSPLASERVLALKEATEKLRDSILDEKKIVWPMYSPGTLNAWLTFIGPSPGNSPGAPWRYDPRPSVGGSHLGVSEYQDKNNFWKRIRQYSRKILADLPTKEAYAQTMVRNLDPKQAAVGPKGSYMAKAAIEVISILANVNRPVLVMPLGGAREYCDSAFQDNAETKLFDSGVLYTSKSRKECPWFSLVGTWPSGEKFLYVSATGIHPSLRHVSEVDTFKFLTDQAKVANTLN